MKRFLHLATVSVALSAIAATIPTIPTPVRAQSQPILLSQSLNFQPPDVTAPANRQGGTHRGNGECPAGLSITPLVPISNIGLTLTDSPTFFVYVPQTDAQIEFTLLTEKEDELVYEKSFKVDKPGIVGVNVPPGAKDKSVQVGKRYVWSFSMICDNQDRSADLVVKGWVERVEKEANVQNSLKKTDPMTRVNFYAQNGIWYETVTTLAELRRQKPGDSVLIAEWNKLLHSQGLDSVATQPLVESL
ncbi:DUF928 domain-containing protein [Microcoleus sp. EPA2]|uniref:DUF928 domain-containing protein n=1 Tax=Microcoleus sp. EPA2 TaxID=2841654 RepID=UPI00312B72F5